MRFQVLPVLCLAGSGCVYPHLPPPPAPTELGLAASDCATTIFPVDPQIAAWSVDKFAGQYRLGSQVLTVRRDDHRLMVTRAGFGTRQIVAKNVESWRWHDACGVDYAFALPPDGPGAWLKITDQGGGVSEWQRTGN